MPWLAQKSFNLSNPNPQNATGVQKSAFGGFGTHAPGTTIQSVVSRLHLQRETCANGNGKTTSMIPLIIFVFGEWQGWIQAGNRSFEPDCRMSAGWKPILLCRTEACRHSVIDGQKKLLEGDVFATLNSSRLQT